MIAHRLNVFLVIAWLALAPAIAFAQVGGGMMFPGPGTPATTGGFGPPQTAWTAGALTSNTGNAGYTERNVAASPSATTGGTQARVTIAACTGGTGSQADAVGIGIQSSGATTGATPVNVTFSGGTGYTLASGAADLVSDWVNITSVNGTIFMVIIDNTAAGGGCQPRVSGTSYIQAATGSASSATCGGCSSNGFTYGIKKIEVR